ncbi:two-component regulator propeller domain-containing protein [Filimonas effusa]|uniref:histidine kinase n=1 Tax=Filimonas effusa TaxID=2508721 RepID=A0A4Q1DBK4_9BACT|nr:two-component regulator propeller domain-containing protein [Filimonas effusa]RXK86841.1 hybrid sensor histidine kinase/response regulator [Filimonas effusa]
MKLPSAYRKTICLALLYCLLFPGNSFAWPDPPISYLGIEQGLSNSSVRNICQDAKGFMWFGTLDGLNRFDGYNFKVFRNNSKDSNSIVYNYINCITADGQGNLWVGTRQGISAYDGLLGKFRTISCQPANAHPIAKISDVIRAVATNRNNDAFIGSENIGLLICSKNSSIAKQLPLILGNRSIVNYSVRSVQMTSDGRIWAFVQNTGICEYDPAKQCLSLKYPYARPSVNMAASGNQLWFTSGLQLNVYDINTATARQVLDLNGKNKGANPIVTVTVDSKGQVWMGRNGDGLVICNPAANELNFLDAGDKKDQLSNGAVYAVYEDRENRKWIGTDRGGVNIIDPRKNRFQLFQHDPANASGLNSNIIQTFYEDAKGLIWIGSEEKGVSVWNRNSNTYKVCRHIPGDPNSLSQDNVRCIIGDHHNNIWVATFLGGINKWDPATAKFKRYAFNNPINGNLNEAIQQVYEDKEHTIWTGTLRQGDKLGALYRYDPAADSFRIFDPSISDLFTLKEDAKGNFWGGTLDHLISIDRRNKQHRSFFIGYTIWDVCLDKQGFLWVATEGGGLFQFNPATGKIIRRFTADDGLPGSSVLKIIDTNDGYFWLSTYHGLAKFNVAEKTCHNYDQSDGLQSNQFQYNAALKLRSGELMFGGVKGFNIFNPKNIVPITSQPRLLLTGISVNSVSLENDNSFISGKDSAAIHAITVPYNKAVLSFSFTALEYSSPQKITYAYYLDGWDRKWNYTSDIRTAAYTHLAEGSYVLRIKCTNVDGVWNPQQVQLHIIILPPWYRSWWAYLFYVLALGALLYLYFSYKTKQARLHYQLTIANLNEAKALAERNKERAELEKERVLNEKEKEINEKRLAFFTNISHEFRTPLTLIINPAKELIGQATPEYTGTTLLRVIYRNARRMLSLVDQLLLFRKAESETDKLHAAKLNCSEVCKEVYLSFTQQARIQQINYSFSCENENLEVFADKEKLEIILYNLISNAMKYTPREGAIRFSVTENNREIEISVADNGQGIPPEVGDRLFNKFYQAEGIGIRKPGFGIGLFLVKYFIELHKGSVQYQSSVGKGTIFSITLLKGTAHLLPGQLISAGEQHFLSGTQSAEQAHSFLRELTEKIEEPGMNDASLNATKPLAPQLNDLVTDRKTMVIVDDDNQIRQYLISVFRQHFTVFEAASGEAGLTTARDHQPDIVISDIKMEGITGIDLCKAIKEDPATSHIPVILLTGTSSPELQLEGVERGADDYITKPFDINLLVARVNSLLKNRNNLQQYFYGEITLAKNNTNVSEEYKAFLEKCISIVEKHLDDESFSVKTFISEMGMSRSNLFRKVKEVSGLSINVFIRFIRLRKAAEILINTNNNVNETAAMVGIIDVQYFREQFTRLFGMKPSEYIKKYRKPFEGKYKVNRDTFQSGK